MSAIPTPKEGWFNLLYFASAKSFTSKDFDTFPAPLELPALFLRLEEMYNGITEKVLGSSMVTINLEYVDVPQPGDESSQVVTIKEGDEVAIIPPVSSG
ncbi:molybdopterin synthase small subunit CnxG [Rostrohypoxylon terebratum]|nr:molybdopterin synthase small subunit CnxG [Rostrohypoxylon terebratum]